MIESFGDHALADGQRINVSRARIIMVVRSSEEKKIMFDRLKYRVMKCGSLSHLSFSFTALGSSL